MEIYYVAICLVILVFAALGNMNPHILDPGTYMSGGGWYTTDGCYMSGESSKGHSKGCSMGHSKGHSKGRSMTGGSLNMPEGKDVTLYYAPWCGHCKNLMPEWDKVEQSLLGDSTVKVNKINCDENPKLAQREGVKGYPTIVLRNRGQKIVYDGKRTANAILSFIHQTE